MMINFFQKTFNTLNRNIKCYYYNCSFVFHKKTMSDQVYCLDVTPILSDPHNSLFPLFAVACKHTGKSSRRRNQICLKVPGCACNMTIIFWISHFSKFPRFRFFFFSSSPIRKSLQKKFSYLYLARAVNYGLTDISWSFFLLSAGHLE